jgi:hypothetical protein
MQKWVPGDPRRRNLRNSRVDRMACKCCQNQQIFIFKKM